MTERKSLHLVISGQVQGVFFRVHTKEMADSLELVGWVKNLPDGEVEVYAKGGPKHLEKFLQWCHKGPPQARVSDVEVVWDIDLGDFSSFEIVR
ncbi:MAG: acylphosphatase [Deltaproteobacteria bacterium]